MFRFERTVTHHQPDNPTYRFSLVWETKGVPVTASFEDDMVAISEKHGSCWKDGQRAFERSRYLHRFALYRWYRSVRRWISPPISQPAVFGELTCPSPGSPLFLNGHRFWGI